jgi:hypothetical protein
MAGRRDALIVATSEYADPKLPNLAGPTHDARELGRVLGDPAVGDFQVEVATDLLVQDLRRRLEAFLLSSGTRHDFLLLYLSCLGIKDDAGRLYFAAADTELEHLFSTGIGDTWLRQLIDESRSQRILLLLDCCFGGSFSNRTARRAPGAEQVGIKERFEGPGRVVLTASTATQYAFEGGQLDGTPEPSIFTNALVTGLTDGAADLNSDGLISVDELYDYAAEFVGAGGSRQTPTKAGYVEGDLVVARSARRPEVATHFASDTAGFKIFISYRRGDAEAYAGRLYDHLRRPFGQANIFMDVDALPPGQDYVEALEAAVATSDVMLAVVGPGWLTAADPSGSVGSTMTSIGSGWRLRLP